MGDRANVVLEEDGQKAVVYLYTHWGGTELPQDLQTALKRNERWDDGAYLGRIIFCQMIKGNEDSATGYGISTTQQDNEYPYLRVSADRQTVTVDYDPVRQYHDHPNKTFTFREFVGLEGVSWELLEALASGAVRAAEES